MISNLRIFHKGLLLVGAPFLLGLIFVGLIASLLLETDRIGIEESKLRNLSIAMSDMIAKSTDSAWAIFASIHPKMSAVGIADPQKKIQEARIATDRVIAASKGLGKLEEALREPLRYQDVINSQMEQIRALAKDNSEDLTDLLKILPLVRTTQETLIEATEPDMKLLALTESMVKQNAKRMESIRQKEAAILIGAVLANLLLAVSLYYYFRKSILLRLEKISNKILLLNSDRALGEAEKGSDEIAMLDASFCSMDKSLRDAAKHENALFNNASDLICVIDEPFQFKKANAASKELLGLDPDKLKHQSIFASIYKEDHQAVINHLKECSSGNPATSFEARVLKADGSMAESAWSVFWEACERSWFCVIHDISEFKKLEQLKSQYFSFASRHLLLPLEKISASIERMQTKTIESNEKVQAKITGLKQTLGRLLALTEDLMQKDLFASNKTPELTLEDLNSYELMKAAANELEPIASKRGIKIEYSGNEGFEADRGRIMQVLINLLSNSIKYSPDNEVVEMRAALSSGGKLKFSIQDRGRGVPAEFQSSIFEKFKQVSAADGKRAAGTGLGLPICKELVEWHKGSIGVESEAGKGSTFCFEIPLTQMPVQNPEHKLSQAHETAAPSLTWQNNPGRSTMSLSQISKTNSGQLSLGRQALILISVPLLLEIILITLLAFVFIQSQALAVAETRERNLSYAALKLWFHYRQSSLDPSKGLKNESPGQLLAQMKRLSAGSKSRLAEIEKIKASCRACEAVLKEGAANQQDNLQMLSNLVKNRGLSTMKSSFTTIRGLMKTSILSRQIQHFISDSIKKQAASPAKIAGLRSTQGILLSSGLILNILISIALAVYFSRRITSRLIHLSNNCRKLAQEQPLAEILEGDDELAHLDRVFHSAAETLLEARSKERSVLYKSKEVICSIDQNGRFVKINPAVEELWQYDAAELADTLVIELCIDEYKELMKANLASDFASNKFEAAVKRKDGSVCHVLWSMSKPPGEAHIFCVAHDISAKIEAEKLTSEFLHMVGHDLRTPLTALMGNSKLLEIGSFGEIDHATKVELAEIMAQASNLLELINDLLDLEKLSAGMMQLELQTQETSELAEELAAIAKRLAIKKNLTLSFKSPEAIMMRCDSERLVQALTNILNFAINETSNSGTMNLSFEVLENVLLIKIESEASQIREDMEIFDRFKAFQHTGSLALPVARQIIESHHGKLDFESKGNAACIKICIPLNAAAAS